jgi:TolB protein
MKGIVMPGKGNPVFLLLANLLCLINRPAQLEGVTDMKALCVLLLAVMLPGVGRSGAYQADVRPDGAELVYLPPAPASAQNPTFSPDGETILFTLFHGSYNEGPAGMYLTVEGGSPVPLLFEEDQDSVNVPGTSWNPVTGLITFASDREDTDEIWIVAPNGDNLARATVHHDDTYYIEPTFSPGGEWIVFEVDDNAPEEDQQGSIWKVRVDGSDLTQLTDGPAEGTDDRLPNWSPVDENLILFQRREVGTDVWNLYVMDSDGKHRRQITDSPYGNTDASWSPDGQWIVYSTDYGGLEHPSIFVVSVSGGEPIRVTNDPNHEDGAPSWSPDGQWIYFESHVTEDEESRSGIWRITAPRVSGSE